MNFAQQLLLLDRKNFVIKTRFCYRISQNFISDQQVSIDIMLPTEIRFCSRKQLCVGQNIFEQKIMGNECAQHWNRNAIILMKFSSLFALKVVEMTTFSATSDENAIKMPTFPFQWISDRIQIDCPFSVCLCVYIYNILPTFYNFT